MSSNEEPRRKKHHKKAAFRGPDEEDHEDKEEVLTEGQGDNDVPVKAASSSAPMLQLFRPLSAKPVAPSALASATDTAPERANKRKRVAGTGVENDDAEGKTADDDKPRPLFRTDKTFAELGLANWLADSCEKLKMHFPTEIQTLCIPQVLVGRNIAGNSKTGSGKTACYCLPILHALSADPYGVFALVLTPVRELAFQVAENFKALGKNVNVQVATIVGGRDMMAQSRMIAERQHVVVATPGRLADLLRGDPDLSSAFSRLHTFVLDEADRMLTQTFEEPLAGILPALPKSRQTLLFSATITGAIEKLKGKLSSSGSELLLLDANPKDQTVETLTHQYVFVPKVVQICYLHYLLKSHFGGHSCIVFCSTIDLCQTVNTLLEILHFPVVTLHSLQSQRRRQACLNSFRAGRATILVATDVAGRGLDIPKVATVINVGLPQESDDYVHRAGRTARAGRPGVVVSLITEQDVPRVHGIEDRLGQQLELLATKEQDVLKLLSKTTKARQKAELLLSEVGFEDKVQEHREARKAARPQLQKKRVVKKKASAKSASAASEL